jgi:hypothetical protein
VEGLWPSCLLRAMWPSGSQGIPGPLSHLRGHVAVCHFEGAMCVGPHLPFFGVMRPFGLFRSHVAIWPSAENDQPRKNCSLLIKSSYENVISWPGLVLGLSEDFIRPDGHMATWSLKGPDGHMASQRSKWRRGPQRMARWPRKGLDARMAFQRAPFKRAKATWSLKGQMATWPLASWPHGSPGHMALQWTRWLHGPSERRMATWFPKEPDGHMAPPSARGTWPDGHMPPKGQMATWPLKGPSGHMGPERVRWPHGP